MLFDNEGNIIIEPPQIFEYRSDGLKYLWRCVDLRSEMFDIPSTYNSS